MKKYWRKMAVILAIGLCCSACGEKAAQTGGENVKSETGSSTASGGAEANGGAADENGMAGTGTVGSGTNYSGAGNGEGSGSIGEQAAMGTAAASGENGGQTSTGNGGASVGNGSGSTNGSQTEIVYPTDLNHNGVQETLTVKFDEDDKSSFKLELKEGKTNIWTSEIHSYSQGAYSLCTEGGLDYLIYYYAGDDSGYYEYRFERFCLDENDFPEIMEQDSLRFSADYAGYPLDVEGLLSFADHVNEHFDKSVLLCGNLGMRLQYSNGQTLRYEEKFTDLLPEADWTGYTTLEELLDYKNEYIYYTYKEEIEQGGAIGGLESDNEYAYYLLAHGQTEVEAEFLKLNPVENIVFVPDGDMIYVYRSGVYCGYFTSVSYGGGEAWSGETREWVQRVFGGARESVELLDWELSGFGPYLQAVGSYESDVYDNSNVTALMANGVFDADTFSRALEGWCACYGVENNKSGYVLWLAEEVVDEELFRELLGAIELGDESFTTKAFAALSAQKTVECRPKTYTDRDLTEMSQKGLVSFEITSGELVYEVPDEMVALHEKDGLWGLYLHLRDGMVKVGEVQVRKGTGEKSGAVTEEKALFTEEQQKWLEAQPDRETMADDTYTLTTTVMVSADGKQGREIRLMEFGE